MDGGRGIANRESMAASRAGQVIRSSATLFGRRCGLQASAHFGEEALNIGLALVGHGIQGIGRLLIGRTSCKPTALFYAAAHLCYQLAAIHKPPPPTFQAVPLCNYDKRELFH
jgi:hypothetical protein